VDLFKSKKGIITTSQIELCFNKLQLKGKNVLVYSRLLGLGRFLGKDAVVEFIRILKASIGEEGTLIIPTYTLNTYKEPREFDLEKSKIMSGILGDVANTLNDFKRTIHPVYSNCIAGKFLDELLEQNITSCFGPNSFFDLFSKLENAYVLMIGLNFNGPTLYHYYEQKFEAKGRFLKSFDVKIKTPDHSSMNKFDSYVKDYSFYYEKTNCLARFDALAEAFKLVKHIQVGDDFIHGISEKDFQLLYKASLIVDQEYFLMGTENEWEEYYLRNKYDLYHNLIDIDRINKVSLLTGYTIK
jgi:aminoglycoside N3'-acetyltransferase